MKRRDFIKSLSAGIASPFILNIFKYKDTNVEYVMPFVEPAENIIPGVANWYASVCRQCTAGCGIHVKISDGDAKKIEGNPSHPVNKGKICSRGQAAVQAIYNPDRIKNPLFRREKGDKFVAITWDEALKVLITRLNELKNKGDNEKLVFLTQPLRGTAGKLMKSFMAGYGSDKLYSFELLNDEALSKANEICFGSKNIPDYDIGNAKFVLSFGSTFLETWLSPVEYSRKYGELRDKMAGAKGVRGKLVQFEPRLSLTGANADEWFPINPGTEGLLALSMANVLVNSGLHDKKITGIEEWKKLLSKYDPKKVAKKADVAEKNIVRIAKEFAKNKQSLALCGGNATAQVNGTFNAVAVNILNYLLGNIDKKGGIRFNYPSLMNEGIEKSISYKELTELANEVALGKVNTLFINNINPVYTMPASTKFNEAMKQIPFIVSFSHFMDETTALADLVLPTNMSLEDWEDYIPPTDTGNQTVGLSQPIVKPQYDTKSIGDTILLLAKSVVNNVAASPLNSVSYSDYLKLSWVKLYEDGRKRKAVKENNFNSFWENSLKKGGYWEDKTNYSKPAKNPTPASISNLSFVDDDLKKEEFNLLTYPSVNLYDGRGANLPWLQQLPDPMVTVTWGSWIEINPETAKELDVKEGDLIEVKSDSGTLKLPAYIYPAINPQTVAIPMGQGHTEYGRYAKRRGENSFHIVSAEEEKYSGGPTWARTTVSITKTEANEAIIKAEPDTVQPGLEEGLREMDRHIVQWVEPEELEKEGEEELEPIKALPSRDLQKSPHFLSSLGLGKYRTTKWHEYKYRWGMVIDLDKCTGCSACMVACYAENNLPIASPIELAKRRHKNWIRVNRYWDGEYPEVKAKLIPVNCFQCGNAPCEPVCPVYASYHTKDGLNGQVYQRCIGTRYCNANCPYKSRLFNWFSPEWPNPMNKQLNHELSVRTSGITDKCTFCVQRIRFAKDKAKDEGRAVKDGEIQTACMQTCPSGAITFGNLVDMETKVSMLTRNPRRYRVLEQLNTEPAVVYLKAVRKGVESEQH